MARVRIVKLPKALVGAETMNPGLYGTNGNNQFSFNRYLQAGKMSEEPIEARQTLGPVDREDANLEAEKGETAVVNIDGIPAHFNIAGKRHSQGGTPLNLPDNSFIFSDTAKMKIKDPVVLAQFGMAPKKGGYTPAEISKKYNVNKFRKILADPNSEDLDRKTAEMMIANYNEKLAKLSLAQESLKGFPQGIPVIAMPYIESMEIDPSTFLPDQAQGQLEEGAQPDTNTGEARYGANIISQWDTKRFGGIPKAQVGLGFSGDPALEKKWSEDSTIGPAYQKYVEALKSKDPKKMQAVSTEFDNRDISGFAWWPGSRQNKLSDFSQILKEEAGKINKRNEVKKPTAEQDDIELRKKAQSTFIKVAALKKLANDAGDVDAAYDYDLQLEKLHKLHPTYKGEHFWRQEERKKEAYSTPGTGEYVPSQAPIYYNENEGNEINTNYDTYKDMHYKPKVVPKAPEKKVAEKATTQETIKPAGAVHINDLSPEEKAFLGLK